mgnify:CR=1 FL=1
MKTDQETLNYLASGVDINRADDLISRIKPIASETAQPGVIGSVGGFGALFEIPVHKYVEPVLVSGTDGVGTKLKLAIDTGHHHSVGEDLVAMCANDIVVSGAEPLFFLDYYATGKLNIDIAESVIRSIANGCRKAGASLVGGETAELPGMYHGDDYDLAGFCVGIVEKEKIIDGSSVSGSDVLIGISSTGLHANGYSLVRKIIETKRSDLLQTVGDQSLLEALLTPTAIYVKAILDVINKHDIHAIAHITGGGITDNLPRVLPQSTIAEIDLALWQRTSIFHWLKTEGNLEPQEMLRTFNCGIGMILCVPDTQTESVVTTLEENGLEASPIGLVSVDKSITSPYVAYQGLAHFG